MNQTLSVLPFNIMQWILPSDYGQTGNSIKTVLLSYYFPVSHCYSPIRLSPYPEEICIFFVVQYGMLPIWNCRLSTRNPLNNRSLWNSSSSLEFVSTGMNHKRKQPLRVNPLHPFRAGVYSDRKTWPPIQTQPVYFLPVLDLVSAQALPWHCDSLQMGSTNRTLTSYLSRC